MGKKKEEKSENSIPSVINLEGGARKGKEPG